MKKIFAGIVTTTLLLTYPLAGFADEGNLYPLKNIFSKGIENVNSSLFLNSKIKRPIETGFEKRGELVTINKENQLSQLTISEDAHSGKFALKIQKLQDDILPIRETDYFRITDVMPDDTASIEPVALAEDLGFSIQVSGKSIMVSGTKTPYEMISLLVEKGDNIAYIDQTTADAKGFFKFNFSLDDYGSYQLSVGGSKSEASSTSLVLDGTNTPAPMPKPSPLPKEPTMDVEVKCNYYTVMIKPLYKSEIISFYVKVMCDDGNGNITEQYVLIKSDKDGDGIYKIGEDLSRGKWQKLELSLTDIDEKFVISSVSGLYMSANQNSEWLIDDITSGYKKINKTKFDLSEFAKENVVFADEELRFANYPNNGNYKTNEQVVSGSLAISDTLSEIYVDSQRRFIIDESIYQEESEKEITSIPFESDKWIVNDTNYDQRETGVSKKKIEIENTYVYMRSQGCILGTLEDVVTNDRVKISYRLIRNENSNLREGTQLELFEGEAEEPYYTTRSNYESSLKEQTITHIVPKIRPNTKIKLTNLEPLRSGTIEDEIKLSNFKITKLQQKDWNLKNLYGNYSFQYDELASDIQNYKNRPFFAVEEVNSLALEEELYATVYPDMKGVVNTETSYSGWDNYTSTDHDFSIYRILNLNTEPVCVEVGTKTIYLNYGLADYYVNEWNYTIKMPPNQKVMLISKAYYLDDMNPGNLYYTNVDGISNFRFVDGGNLIYYANKYDNNSAYVYSPIEKTNQKLSNHTLVCTSPDGTHFLMKSEDDCYYILNKVTGQKTTVGEELSYNKYFFNSKNQLFMFMGDLDLYCYTENGIKEIGSRRYASGSGAKSSYALDPSGEYLLWSYYDTATLYKNTNGIWNEVASFSSSSLITQCALSKDASTVYLGYISYDTSYFYCIDVNTNSTTGDSGSIVQVTDENTLLIKDENYYYIYNHITGEKHKVFDYALDCNDMYYNPKTNLVIGVMPDGSIFRYYFTTEQPEPKFALSFDGRDNWYVYSGGRWITVSNENTPKIQEMQLSGMTAEAINSIPSSAYDKLYRDGSDILTVDVAIYMYSHSNNQTPVIEDITVKTIEEDDLSGLYGVHLEKYEKDEFRSINSLFPIENFGSNAECYYLLYIGNDWLYTYKNNELIKVEEPADILLKDITKSWITFKQYGMDAQELRCVPSDVLNDLFVNKNYANTEFGVIYVIKTKDEDTTDYTVSFRLGSSSNFITEEDIVVKILMNGGSVTIIDSNEYSVTDIENLLSWIESRQTGNGEIFFRLKNAKTQHFINYYMINSISVFNGEEYRSKETE